MSITSEYPFEPRRSASVSGDGTGRGGSRAARPSAAGGFLAALAILIGSGLLGLAGGLLWTQLAPRAVYVVVARGSADVVNPETSAFIAADAWYCLIGAAGGLIIGLAGYLFAVRRYGPVPMAAILAGSVLAGIAARWVGEHQGLHQFDRQLLTVHQGTLLHAPLALAGDTKAAIWPTVASLPAVAFWPLAACLVAGGIVFFGALRHRSAQRSRESFGPGSTQFPFYQGQ
jgi:hypothetical protein